MEEKEEEEIVNNICLLTKALLTWGRGENILTLGKQGVSRCIEIRLYDLHKKFFI